jgi:hypothetical protein
VLTIANLKEEAHAKNEKLAKDGHASFGDGLRRQ